MRTRGNNIILLWLLAILCPHFDLSGAKVLKGFHFNKNRGQLWTIPSDEVKNNTDWYYDFAKYGNCLRMNIPPFTMPKQFTICYKINHDFYDTFYIMNMVSTKTGNSAMEDLKTNP